MPTPPPALAAFATDPRHASTLAHGLDLLEAFAGGPAVLANAELARRSGLSKASVSRLSLTLASRGLLESGPDGRGHRLAAGMLSLGYPLLAQLGLRRAARLPMKQLADALGASVSLGLREGGRMVYVETLRGSDPAGFQPDLGAALPMLATAMGRAWLAQAAPAERDRVLADLRAAAPDAVAAAMPALARARRALARDGFCTAEGDWQPDIHAVAVPLGVTVLGERLVLNCGLPARRLPPGALHADVAPRLLALARRIEADWRDLPAAPVPVRPSATPAPPGDDTPARTLARGIDLLQAFRPHEAWLGNRELARRLGLGPSTVVRLTHTLCERGYLHQEGPGGRYRLGAATLAAAYPLLSGLAIRRVARPVMLSLAERLGAAVSLGLRHRDAMVYVETAWRTDERLLPPDTGAPLPLLATAMGRAWLAQAPGAERAQVLRRLALADPAGNAGQARLHAAAAEAVRACRRQGWCASHDFRPEIVAVAVPLALRARSAAGAPGAGWVMNCGLLRRNAATPAAVARAGEALREAALAVEQALAG